MGNSKDVKGDQTMSMELNFTKRALDQLAFSENGKPFYYGDSKTPGLKLKVGKTKKTFLLEKRISGSNGSAMVRKLGTFPTMTVEDVRKEARRIASLCEQGIDPRVDERSKLKSLKASNPIQKPKASPLKKRKNGKNRNHPKKGSSIKVSPITERSAIEKIKHNLRGNPRDLCFFIFGINTAFRACELLSLKVSHVQNLKAGDDFEIKLRKTKTYRRVTLNHAVVEAVRTYLSIANLSADDWLFANSRSGEPLGVPTLSRYVKRWCNEAGLHGNYASHTLRKTWGYWQRVANDTPIPLLMVAYGHSTQQQTLQYLCIQNEEISDIYLGLVL